MNTNNVTPLEYKKENCFEFIFENMYPLFKDYMKRDNRSSWEEGEFDINISDDQLLLKTFLQINFVEELNEATMGIENRDHFVEEMVDAFNFLLASYFIFGTKIYELDKWEDSADVNGLNESNRRNLYSEFYLLIEQVGRACNLLKNYRSWKSCQYRTDLYLFNKEFKRIWSMFNRLCNKSGISAKELFEVWSCKFQINKFRIESNY